MNVEIRIEAAQFLFWESINGIFVAVFVLFESPFTFSTVSKGHPSLAWASYTVKYSLVVTLLVLYTGGKCFSV